MTRPYTYRPPQDEPPPPALIDALADKPLAPEIAECETCPHLADCRRNYAQHRRFARSECSRALTPILPRNDGNATNQYVLAELRRAPATVQQLIGRTGLSMYVLYKVLNRLLAAGHVTADTAPGVFHQPRTFYAKEQPC